MRRKAVVLACGLLLVALTAAAADWKTQLPPPDRVADYLQDISVNVKASLSEGSGVVTTREIDGRKINFVWTAAHVVEGLRSVEEVIDSATGTKRQKVTFRDAQVVKELVEGGRRVGELKMDAEVIRYSEEEDLALLRIRKADFVQASAVFYLDEAIPPIGTELYHVGSLLGQMGANSMTSGIVSQIGRTLDKKEYDQTTVTAFPGSSGGGVYLKNGAYVSMVVRGAGEGFNLCIPVRRIREWAESAGVTWAIDDSVKAPTEEELKKMPIEDAGVSFSDGKDDKHWSEFPYLIKPCENGYRVWRRVVPGLYEPQLSPADVPTLPRIDPNDPPA